MRPKPSPQSALYGAVFVLHLGLLWTLPFFPSEDGPSHVYNTLIVRDLIHGGQTYGAFFNLHLKLVPNLGALVPLYALSALLPPLVAEKVFLTLVMSLIVGVMPRLARMVGAEPYPGCFVVFPLLYSALVLYGFYSFLLGLALCLWALCFYWQARSRPFGQRWLLSAFSAIVLFVCHLFPCLCYAMAVVVAEMLWPPSPAGLAVRIRTVGVHMLVPVALVGVYAWVLATTQYEIPSASPLSSPTASSALGAVNLLALLYLFTLGQPALALGQIWTGVAMGVVLTWLFVRPSTGLARQLVGSGPGANERFARWWLAAVAALLVAAMLVVPDSLGELTHIKLRFPSLACLLLVPLASCVTALPALRRVVLAVSLAGSIANAWYVVQAARDVETLVTAVPGTAVQGRFVAGYVGVPLEGFAKYLLHSTSYYCAMEACIDLGNYQALSPSFFVSFKPNPTLAVSRDIDINGETILWERYPQVASLRGWNLSPAERGRVARTFDLAGEVGAVTVWKAR